jgi:hypothetical protein
MKYLLLEYGNEFVLMNMPKSEAEKTHAAYMAYTEAMKKAGVLLGSAPRRRRRYERLQRHAAGAFELRDCRLSADVKVPSGSDPACHHDRMPFSLMVMPLQRYARRPDRRAPAARR